MAKILFVMTGASYWTLKDGHRHPTGYRAEELAAPYSAFTEAGHEITVATPDAVVPTVDTMSLRPDMAGSEQKAREEEDVIERADELRWPIALKDVRLEDYDAVYYPGGHGPMEARHSTLTRGSCWWRSQCRASRWPWCATRRLRCWPPGTRTASRRSPATG